MKLRLWKQLRNGQDCTQVGLESTERRVLIEKTHLECVRYHPIGNKFGLPLIELQKMHVSCLLMMEKLLLIELYHLVCQSKVELYQL